MIAGPVIQKSQAQLSAGSKFTLHLASTAPANKKLRRNNTSRATERRSSL